ADPDYQDRVEAGTLYELFEHEVGPPFYSPGPDGSPGQWIALMKSAMGDLCPVFNNHRMLRPYAERAYAPPPRRLRTPEAAEFRAARELAAWRRRVREGWNGVKVVRVETDLQKEVSVGESFTAQVWIDPGSLRPEDLTVQVVLGRVDESQALVPGRVIPMSVQNGASGDALLFRARVPLESSG